jgi:hypothetical protein
LDKLCARLRVHGRLRLRMNLRDRDEKPNKQSRALRCPNYVL